MENRNTQTEVTVSGRKFQLNKVDARASCWLYSVLGRSDGGTLRNALSHCTKEEFFDIQNSLLKTICDITDGFPTAVLAPNGELVGDLKTDADTVMKLTLEALNYNLKPFLHASDSNSAQPQ